jgi:hypothetical protein
MIDMPGTGGSPALRLPLRMSGYATLVVGVLDQLGIERAGRRADRRQCAPCPKARSDYAVLSACHVQHPCRFRTAARWVGMSG